MFNYRINDYMPMLASENMCRETISYEGNPYVCTRPISHAGNHAGGISADSKTQVVVAVSEPVPELPFEAVEQPLSERIEIIAQLVEEMSLDSNGVSVGGASMSIPWLEVISAIHELADKHKLAGN